MIIYQGVFVYDLKNDKKFYGCEIKLEDVKKFVRFVKDEGIYVYIYIDNIWYVEVMNEKIEYYKNFIKFEFYRVENFFEFIDRFVIKVLFFDEYERLKVLKERFFKDFLKKFNIMFLKFFFLEFIDINVLKGNVFKFLIEYYDLKREEVMVIGDGDNDILMIEYVGVGVVVGNVIESLKSVVNFVVVSCDESGFVEVIEKVFNVYF